MNFRHVRMLLLLFTMILWNVLINTWILERTRQINCFSYETALYSFREHRVSGELLARMQEEAGEKGIALGRDGQKVCDCEVVSCKTAKAFDHTNLLTIKVPSDMTMKARFYKRA